MQSFNSQAEEREEVSEAEGGAVAVARDTVRSMTPVGE